MDSSGDRVRLAARVQGDVQGVGYRFFAQRQASALGLCGYTRNLHDGSVEVVAEGARAALNRYLDALRRGPSAAVVSEVETTWGAATGEFSGFRIRR